MKILIIVLMIVSMQIHAEVMQVQTTSGCICIPVNEIESITFAQVAVETVEMASIKVPISMLRNYPNPFNPATKILFETSESGKVEVTIYNIKGQKVLTLLKETLAAGKHEVVWQGKNADRKSVASGVYLYKVRVNKQEKISKMILVK